MGAKEIHYGQPRFGGVKQLRINPMNPESIESHIRRDTGRRGIFNASERTIKGSIEIFKHEWESITHKKFIPYDGYEEMFKHGFEHRYIPVGRTQDNGEDIHIKVRRHKTTRYIKLKELRKALYKCVQINNTGENKFYPYDSLDNLVLVPDMLPDSVKGINLRNRVSINIWNRIRHEVYGANGFKCCICDKQGRDSNYVCSDSLHAHEVFSYDPGTRVATLTDIIPVCQQCHNVIHWDRSVFNRNPDIKNHFNYVNRTGRFGYQNDYLIHRCVSYAYDIRDYLNQIKWTVDIDFIKKKYRVRG